MIMSKIRKYRTNVTKWALVKLIDLAKGDYWQVARWLDGLKEKAIKDQFKPFKIMLEGNGHLGDKRSKGSPILMVQQLDIKYINLENE